MASTGMGILLCLVAALDALPAVGGQEPTAVVSCDTTVGQLDINIFREWAPKGADHFLELVQDGWYTDIALFRAVQGFLVQFGINTDESLREKWGGGVIDDDPSQDIPFQLGTLSYAGSGPNSRSNQVFLALGPNPNLGQSPWETPIGRVAESSMDTLMSINTDYGDMPPWGDGPDPAKIQQRGNAYVREGFPKIDFIRSCRVADATGHDL